MLAGIGLIGRTTSHDVRFKNRPNSRGVRIGRGIQKENPEGWITCLVEIEKMPLVRCQDGMTPRVTDGGAKVRYIEWCIRQDLRRDTLDTEVADQARTISI